MGLRKAQEVKQQSHTDIYRSSSCFKKKLKKKLFLIHSIIDAVNVVWLFLRETRLHYGLWCGDDERENSVYLHSLPTGVWEGAQEEA